MLLIGNSVVLDDNGSFHDSIMYENQFSMKIVHHRNGEMRSGSDVEAISKGEKLSEVKKLLPLGGRYKVPKRNAGDCIRGVLA